MRTTLLLLIISITSCGQQEISHQKKIAKPNIPLEKYIQTHVNDSTHSVSIGAVSNGQLKNGKLVPFMGTNYQYFDEKSYLSGRAFTNSKVLATILDGYKQLEVKYPKHFFRIMECSHEHGGKMWPHRTHQNGLSIDFMMPKLKDNKAYYGLDSIGTDHYFLSFDNNGNYTKDTSISINFELIAHHILILQKAAKKQHLKISKVIIKTEFKNKLFSGYYGKQLKDSGIYIVKSLSPLINSLHDEHYHIDFKEI